MSIAKSCQVQTLDNGAAEVLFVEREPAPRTPPKVSSKASPMRQRPLLKPRLFRASSDSSAALLSEKKDASNTAGSVPVPAPPRKTKSSSQLLETFDGGGNAVINTMLPPRWSRPRGRRDSSVQESRSKSPAGTDECESRSQAEEEEPEETTSTSTTTTSKRPQLEGRTEEDHTEDRTTAVQSSLPDPTTRRSREKPCQTFQLRILQGKNLPEAANRCRVWVQDEVIAEQSLSAAPEEEATTTSNCLGGLPFTLEVQGHLSTKICVQLLTPMAATSQVECTLQDLLVSNPKAYPNQWRTLQPVVVEAQTDRATSPNATTTSASPYNSSEDQQSTSPVHLPSLQMRLSKLSHPSWGVVRETLPTIGNKVWLHVYDVTKRSNVQNVNALLKPMGMGGLYHAAIEIHGREYSFGGSQDSQGTGIYAYLPKQCPWHNYRESVYLGECELSKKQVRAVLKSMEPRWMATSYNLFRKNCCGFSEEFAKELGVNTLPRWLHVLAEKTVHLEPLLQGIDRCQPFIGLQLSSLDSMNVNSDITSVNCDQMLAVQ